MVLVKKVIRAREPSSAIGAIAVRIQRPVAGGLRVPRRARPLCAVPRCANPCRRNARAGKAVRHQTECGRHYRLRLAQNAGKAPAERVPPPAPTPAVAPPATPPRPAAPAAMVPPPAPARVRRPTVEWPEAKKSKHPISCLQCPRLQVSKGEFELREELYAGAKDALRDAEKARDRCVDKWGGPLFPLSIFSAAMQEELANHQWAVDQQRSKRDALLADLLRCDVVTE